MYEKEDAFDLVSGAEIEKVYAGYANTLKILGDRARKEALDTPNLKYSPSAKITYAPEVKGLISALDRAKSNSPL